jgi:hypothetical protein
LLEKHTALLEKQGVDLLNALATKKSTVRILSGYCQDTVRIL